MFSSLLGMSSAGHILWEYANILYSAQQPLQTYCFELTRCSTEARRLLYQIRHSDLHPSFKWGEEKKVFARK